MNKNFFDMMFSLAKDIEPVGSAKVISCIARRKSVVSWGLNKNKTSPFQKKYSKNDDAIFLHAEIDAIKNSLRQVNVDDLKYCDIYILRVKRDGRDGPFVCGLSKPCDGCSKAILAFGLKNVYFTINNGNEFICL